MDRHVDVQNYASSPSMRTVATLIDTKLVIIIVVASLYKQLSNHFVYFLCSQTPLLCVDIELQRRTPGSTLWYQCLVVTRKRPKYFRRQPGSIRRHHTPRSVTFSSGKNNWWDRPHTEHSRYCTLLFQASAVEEDDGFGPGSASADFLQLVPLQWLIN